VYLGQDIDDVVERPFLCQLFGIDTTFYGRNPEGPLNRIGYTSRSGELWSIILGSDDLRDRHPRSRVDSFLHVLDRDYAPRIRTEFSQQPGDPDTVAVWRIGGEIELGLWYDCSDRGSDLVGYSKCQIMLVFVPASESVPAAEYIPGSGTAPPKR
jgi:hypothetical protein